MQSGVANDALSVLYSVLFARIEKLKSVKKTDSLAMVCLDSAFSSAMNEMRTVIEFIEDCEAQ
jgi:hypothetical protein